MSTSNESTIASVLARALASLGVQRVYGLPGGGSSPVIRELERCGVRFVLTHSETAAVLMASTEGDGSTRPGVALTALGPGAASSVNGMAHCLLDRVPLLLITDRLPRRVDRGGSHQQLDHKTLFQGVAKESIALEKDGAEEAIEHAIRVAMEGTPGPVHLDLATPGAVVESPHLQTAPRFGQPTAQIPREVIEHLSRAQHPLLIAGLGSRGLAPGSLTQLCTDLQMPALTTYKGKGGIDETSQWSAGVMTGGVPEQQLLDQADLILSVGLDGIELLNAMPRLRAHRVSLDAYAPPPGLLPPATVSVVGPLTPLVDDLPRQGRSAWTLNDVQSFRRTLEEQLASSASSGTGVHPWAVASTMEDVLEWDTEITVDAGAHMLPITQAWRARNPGQFWISNGIATMGYALPAGIARSTARPDRHVVACTGDAGLLMVLGELGTAARVARHLTLLVFEDRTLSLIRSKQDPRQAGLGTDFGGPSWNVVTEGFGFKSTRAKSVEDLQAALASTVKGSGLSAVIVEVDPEPYREMLQILRG